ncbi:MAG: hypothetical protein IJQ68_10450 [Methanobrevibacter sp.]|uniref:hypothetical protein n=1 Tax=Methanobrevibacter sp. TaxID=66852 RepID=UPI0025E543A2|nr:hypothetical protein [Methanobrevibacter sp.]MBR0272387.1 hypothetical protein [Methanobrevibacter sp.]
MSLESTTKLLKKYNNYVPGEKRTHRQEKIHKQKQRLQEKHLIADELLNETKFLIFTEYQKQHIHYLIDKFQDFRKLHGNCSKEAIILTFIFYVAKINEPKLKLCNYRVTKKYGLTDNVFELIICRLVQALLSESKIVPVGTTKYDQDLLYRTGQR